MARVKALWLASPPWVRYTMRAVVFLALLLVFTGVNSAISDTSAVAGLADFTVLVLFLVWICSIGKKRQNNVLGGPGQSQLFRQALRSGTIPDSAAQPAWRAALADRTQRARRARGFMLACAVVSVLFFGTQFVYAFVDQPEHRLGITAGGMALLLLALAPTFWLLLRYLPRQQKREATLARQLEISKPGS